MTLPTMKSILILTAMKAEAQPIIDKLALEKVPGGISHPMELYQGIVDGLDCKLVINGTCERYGVDRVGTQPATIAAWEAIRQFQPSLIINAGTAGAFKKQGAKINDIYLSEDKIIYHDRRIPLPGFERYGVGHYPCHSMDELKKACQLKSGIITSGNSLDMSPEDEKIIHQEGAQIKDMEAAAIAEVAWMTQTPVIAIKSITDLIDSQASTAEEFLENFNSSVTALAEKMNEVLHYIASVDVLA